MVLADSGEDAIVSCDSCEYAANVEKAELRDPATPQATPTQTLTKVATPGQRTIEEVAGFLKARPEQLIKTLILRTDAGETVV